MSNEFIREERYIVFKISDLGNFLKADEIRRLAREYAEQRRLKGKKPLECVVVEKDWPEYEPTWKAIEARVNGAQPAPSFADAYQGAMEEVAIWKKRALEAEDLNRKFVAEINGPMLMGEPAAQPAPSVPDSIIADAARYQFLRNGGAYLEPNEGEIYMATDYGAKYYKDLREFDMDIDEALAAAANERSEYPEAKP